MRVRLNFCFVYILVAQAGGRAEKSLKVPGFNLACKPFVISFARYFQLQDCLKSYRAGGRESCKQRRSPDTGHSKAECHVATKAKILRALQYIFVKGRIA